MLGSPLDDHARVRILDGHNDHNTHGLNPILIVDDDASIRRLFSIALQRAGFNTDEAANGREALNMIAITSYSAVLLDNHMPELAGLNVIEQLRSHDETATLPIILVTGAAEVSERVQGLQAGASDYLTKPVELDELVARVRAQLRGQAAWMHRVEGHLRERAAIARALAQIKPADTPEATASVICFELNLLHQLQSVAILAFEQGDMVSVLGEYGESIFREEIGEILDPVTARYLLHKVQRGPWCDRINNLPSLSSPNQGLDHNTVLSFAPLATEDRLLGVLLLASNTSGVINAVADSTETLSAAIDFASITAGLLAPALSARGRDKVRHAVISRVIDLKEFYPVFQPIVSLSNRGVIGFEALTRFRDGTRPDLRFVEAGMLGRGLDLELATLDASLRAARSLPPDAFISINVSPSLVMETDVLDAVIREANRPVVLELTEHERVDDYAHLRESLSRLHGNIRLSVDDAGSGFASLRHVLSLRPHFVKLDLSLVRDIHSDPARQALVAGIEYFATETSSRLIAEGIETAEEMETLQRLDVELGQGYLVGKPVPLESINA